MNHSATADFAKLPGRHRDGLAVMRPPESIPSLSKRLLIHMADLPRSLGVYIASSSRLVDGASLCQEGVSVGCRVAGGGPGK